MPSSIERSAPAENASLAEVMTTPFTAASAEVCFTISCSSPSVGSSSTFIERPGMSHVTSAIPSASVSTLKFLKAMLSLPIFLDAFDDGRGAHAATDAQRDQCGRFVGAFQFVQHRAQYHRAGSAERMAQRDSSAIDVDPGVVDIEGLHVAEHDRRKGLVQFEQIDIRFVHARTFEQLLGHIDRTCQHHCGLGTDICEGADLCAWLQPMPGARLFASEQHRPGAVDDP